MDIDKLSNNELIENANQAVINTYNRQLNRILNAVRKRRGHWVRFHDYNDDVRIYLIRRLNAMGLESFEDAYIEWCKQCREEDGRNYAITHNYLSVRWPAKNNLENKQHKNNSVISI